MKNDRIIFLPSLLLLLLSILFGCKDFLNDKVKGNTTAEDFYDTSYKLQAALNASYDVLQMDMYNECEVRFGDALADDVWGNDEGLGSQMGQLVQFRFNTSNEWVLNRYRVNYEGIHRVNQVIANAHRVQFVAYDYNDYRTLRQMVGQAKFLRALFYFNLVKTYGGVPIRPEIEAIEKLVIPRSTSEEVYAYIEKDLREAAVMLPIRYNGLESGKVGSGSAVALLMKVIMYQTTPGILSDKWQEVVRLGEYFIDGHQMTYGDILKYDPANETWEALRKRLFFRPIELNKNGDPYEMPHTALPIQNAFSLEYKDYYGKTIGYIDQFFHGGEFCKGSVFEVVFKESADGTSGDINEGVPIYDNLYSNNPQMWTTAGLIDEIFGNDPRRSLLVTHQNYSPDGEQILCGPGRFLSLKWYTPLKERPQYGGDNGKNRRVIRYADVVLMYAEALNECQLGARALVQLNKNKAEANKINASTTLYVGGGYGFMRDQIWKERRIELCFEWERFFDLVRQKRAATVIRNYGAQRANKRGYFFREGVNELFPIPQAEIDISNGIVKQNPGY